MNALSKTQQMAFNRPAETSVSAAQIERAMVHIAGVLRRHDTDSTRELRLFIWSLWNGDHFINIYRLGCVLDAANSEAVGIIFLAYMRSMLCESHIEWVLVESGEMLRLRQASEINDKLAPGRPVDYPPIPSHLLKSSFISGHVIKEFIDIWTCHSAA